MQQYGYSNHFKNCLCLSFFLVEWLRNDIAVSSDPGSNFFVTQEGNLIVQAQKIEDSGNYTCVAKNLAGKRRSHTAVVNVGGMIYQCLHTDLEKIIVSISVQYKKFRWKLNTYPAVIISFPKSISFVFLPSFRLLPPPPLSLALKWH